MLTHSFQFQIVLVGIMCNISVDFLYYSLFEHPNEAVNPYFFGLICRMNRHGSFIFSVPAYFMAFHLIVLSEDFELEPSWAPHYFINGQLNMDFPFHHVLLWKTSREACHLLCSKEYHTLYGFGFMVDIFYFFFFFSNSSRLSPHYLPFCH